MLSKSVLVSALLLTSCATPSTILQNNQGQMVTCSAAGFGILGTATALVAHGNCVDTYEAAGFHKFGSASAAAQSKVPSTNIPSTYVQPSMAANIPATLTSKDGQIQLLLVPGWMQAEPTSPNMIYAHNPSLDTYLVVTTDDKRDIEDLRSYGAAMEARLVDRFTESQVPEIKNIMINGHVAMRFEASGVVNGVRIHYLATIVETQTKMLELNAWTVESKFADRRDGMATLASGLSETSLPVASMPQAPAAIKYDDPRIHPQGR